MTDISVRILLAMIVFLMIYMSRRRHAGSGSSVPCTTDVSPLWEGDASIRSRLPGMRRVADDIGSAR